MGLTHVILLLGLFGLLAGLMLLLALALPVWGRYYMTLVHWYQLVPVRLGFWLLPILAPILLGCGLFLLACTCYLWLVILIII
jgi:hypothetical protein